MILLFIAVVHPVLILRQTVVMLNAISTAEYIATVHDNLILPFLSICQFSIHPIFYNILHTSSSCRKIVAVV